MPPTLLLIDLQRDYFPGGAFPLVEPDAAADAAAGLLERFRAAGAPVVHVQHVWDAPDAVFMRPGTDGVEIDPRVAPADGEPLFVKANPNAFLDTDLGEELGGGGELVVAGMMTSMCVDATVRAAADIGYEVTVAGDACAAPDLAHDGTEVPGAQVHAAFLAALAGNYATVVRAGDVEVD